MIFVFMKLLCVEMRIRPSALEEHAFSSGDKVRLPDGRNYRIDEVDFSEGVLTGRPNMPVDWLWHFWYYAQTRWKGGFMRSA